METDVLLTRWSGALYGFVADFMREQGFEQIAWSAAPTQSADVERFFSRMEMLYQFINLANAYARIVGSAGNPDPDDVHLVGRLMQEFELVSPHAVQELKISLRNINITSV